MRVLRKMVLPAMFNLESELEKGLLPKNSPARSGVGPSSRAMSCTFPGVPDHRQSSLEVALFKTPEKITTPDGLMLSLFSPVSKDS